MAIQMNNYLDSDNDDFIIGGSKVFFTESNITDHLYQRNICTKSKFETLADITAAH
jgi:hypothetical protein